LKCYGFELPRKPALRQNRKLKRHAQFSCVRRIEVSKAMNIMAFIDSCRRLLKLATKPSRDELSLSIKLCFAGIAIIGLIGFVIRFISAMLQGFAAT